MESNTDTPQEETPLDAEHELLLLRILARELISLEYTGTYEFIHAHTEIKKKAKHWEELYGTP